MSKMQVIKVPVFTELRIPVGKNRGLVPFDTTRAGLQSGAAFQALQNFVVSGTKPGNNYVVINGIYFRLHCIDNKSATLVAVDFHEKNGKWSQKDGDWFHFHWKGLHFETRQIRTLHPPSFAAGDYDDEEAPYGCI
jgi:hypothetical protein